VKGVQSISSFLKLQQKNYMMPLTYPRPISPEKVAGFLLALLSLLLIPAAGWAAS
jgi:hypothetical protein